MAKRIFLSSTGMDLYAHRDAVSQAINLIDGAECIAMETFGPSDQPPARLCEEKVLSCDLFIGLVGFHLGSRPVDFVKSYTQLEFEWSHDIEQLIWVAPNGAPLPQIDQPGKDLDQQRKFRNQLINGETKTVVMDNATWSGPFPLANSVLIALFKRLRSPGYTEEQHRAKLRLREREISSELNKASLQKLREREEQLQQSILEIRGRLANIQADFEVTNKSLIEAREKIAKLDNWAGRQQTQEALDALNVGDLSLASNILSDVSKSWQERMETPRQEAAKAEFALGKIADAQAAWRTAWDHYYRAANLRSESPYYKMRLACASVTIGDKSGALAHGNEAIWAARRAQSNGISVDMAALMYDMAYIVSNTGNEVARVDGLLSECLAICKETYGEDSNEYRYFIGRKAGFLAGKRLERRKMFLPHGDDDS